MATVQDQFNTREKESQANIKSTYDTALNTQKQGLLDAYNANTAAQEQQGQDIRKNYGIASADVGVQNAREARNTAQFADVRGVNTGMGSQHQLNLAGAAAQSNAVIDFARQQALEENERQKQLMTSTYQNQVQAAVADNDYKRAAALLDDYKNQRNWQEQQAQILASYGNFDPYASLYGQDAANGMQSVWNAQHPEEAYRLGRIDAETYKNITGKYPRGYTPPSTGGWGYYYGGSGTAKEQEYKLAGKVGFKEPLVQNKGQRRPVTGKTTVTPDAYKKAQQAKAASPAGAVQAYNNNLAYAAQRGVPIKNF